MNPILIEKQFQTYTAQHGGHEKRFYLGMSGISSDESELLNGLIHGSPEPTQADYDRLALGNEWEGIIRTRLERSGLARPNSQRTLKAFFDPRFEGHTDGEWSDGSLLEIKTTVDSKLASIEAKGKLPFNVFAQVQMYLHHGKYNRGFVLYFARDTGRSRVMIVHPNPKVIGELNDKAKRILAAYDRYNA